MDAIGIFGGTFDPIHFGHLRLAEEMAEAAGLDRVMFIPAGQPPHRGAPRTSGVHRLEMVRRAIATNPRFTVDAREVDEARPSYTVDTLTALRQEFGAEQPLWLLLGADAFLDLPSWHRWERLFDLTNIAVAARPGMPLAQSEALPESLRREVTKRQAQSPAAHPAAGTIRLCSMTPLAISATAIRNALSNHTSARYLLPDSVLDYIHEHQLYTHS